MRWRGRPPIGGQDSDRVSHRCSAPYTLLPLRGISPQGETRNLRRKTESHILHVPLRHSPFGGWRHMNKPLCGLRVDGPLGRRFLRGLSLTRLWREGCGRAPLNYRRRPLMKKTLQPPCGRRKTGQPPWWAKEIPPLVANATTFAPLRGGTITRAYCRAAYEVRLRGVLFCPCAHPA